MRKSQNPEQSKQHNDRNTICSLLSNSTLDLVNPTKAPLPIAFCIARNPSFPDMWSVMGDTNYHLINKNTVIISRDDIFKEHKCIVSFYIYLQDLQKNQIEPKQESYFSCIEYNT